MGPRHQQIGDRFEASSDAMEKGSSLAPRQAGVAREGFAGDHSGPLDVFRACRKKGVVDFVASCGIPRVERTGGGSGVAKTNQGLSKDFHGVRPLFRRSQEPEFATGLPSRTMRTLPEKGGRVIAGSSVYYIQLGCNTILPLPR